MPRIPEELEALYSAREAARRAAMELRAMADALDEAGPVPPRYPCEEEVRAMLAQIAEAKSRLRNRRQVQWIDAWLERAPAAKRRVALARARSVVPHA